MYLLYIWHLHLTVFLQRKSAFLIYPSKKTTKLFFKFTVRLTSKDAKTQKLREFSFPMMRINLPLCFRITKALIIPLDLVIERKS